MQFQDVCVEDVGDLWAPMRAVPSRSVNRKSAKFVCSCISDEAAKNGQR